MTASEKIKIIDKNIEQNKAQGDLDIQTANHQEMLVNMYF